jgi:nucleotide-binding universal stress UspA family protein
MRDLLVLVDGSAAGRGRLRLARTIARQHKACLSAVFLGKVEECPLWAADGQLAQSFSSGPLEVQELAVIPRVLDPDLLDWMGCHGSGGDCYAMERIEVAGLISLAMTADLAIVGQVDRQERNVRSWHPEKIVLACGRPVLMVPYAGQFDQVGRRVLIAWNGSRGAVRALNDAIPLMAYAQEVVLMVVRGDRREFERDRPLLEQQVLHLHKHGIYARIEETLHDGNPVSGVLLSKSVDFASDLLVAGASRSQLRDVIVGGVSRGLFQQMTLPVLMSH